MREYKFRMYDTLENQFMFQSRVIESRLNDLNKNERWIYQQWTGLVDKNGKEIYEGDIVKREFEIYEKNWEGSVECGDLAYTEEISDSGYFIGVVNLRPSEGYVLNKCKKFDDEGNFLLKKSGVKLHSQYAEVIGNVFENPELLEGK